MSWENPYTTGGVSHYGSAGFDYDDDCSETVVLSAMSDEELETFVYDGSLDGGWDDDAGAAASDSPDDDCGETVVLCGFDDDEEQADAPGTSPAACSEDGTVQMPPVQAARAGDSGQPASFGPDDPTDPIDPAVPAAAADREDAPDRFHAHLCSEARPDEPDGSATARAQAAPWGSGRYEEPPEDDCAETVVLQTFGGDDGTPAADPAAAGGPAPAPAPVPTAPLLVFVRENGERVELWDLPAVIGKGTRADVMVSGNPSISRTHARVSRSGNLFVIEDLATTNGTFLNGVRVSSGKAYLLEEGAEVRMGSEVFRVQAG